MTKLIPYRFFVLLVLFLLKNEAYAQFRIGDIDSLKIVVDKLSGTQKIDALNTLSFNCQLISVELSLGLAAEALEQSLEIGYEKGRGLALIHVGIAQQLAGDSENSLRNIVDGIELSKKFGSKSIEGYGLAYYAKAMITNNEYEKANKIFKQSYLLLKDSLNPVFLSILYKHWGEFYGIQSSLKDEEIYLLRSLSIREKLNNPLLLVDIYTGLITFYNNVNRPDEVASYVKKIELFDTILGSETINTFELQFAKAVILMKQSKLVESLKAFNELKEKINPDLLPEGYADVILNIGYIQADFGNFDLSLVSYYEVLNLAEEKKLLYVHTKILWQIGYVHYKLNHDKKAEEFILKGQSMAIKYGFLVEEATTYNMLGLLHARQNLYDSAQEYYQRSLSIREHLGDPLRVAATLNNIGDLLEMQWRLKEALQYFEKALKIGKENDDILGMAWAYHNLGRLYFKQKDYDLALEMLEKAEKITKQVLAKNILLAILKIKVDVYKSLNKTEEALAHLEQYSNLKDSISSGKLVERISSIQTQYVVNGKNQEIEILNKNIALHQIQITQHRIVIVVGIVGGLILLVSLIIVYRHYKTVTNLNQEIQIQNEVIQTQAEEMIESNQLLKRLNREIEDQKNIIQAQGEERYRSIFDGAIEGFYQSTPEGKFINLNPAMAKMFGYDSVQDMMFNVTNIATQLYADLNLREEIKNEIIASGKAFGLIIKAFKKNREIIYVRINAQAIYDEDRKIKYFEGTVEDFTTRIESEQLLEAKNEELVVVNSQMERFFYSASHDLRSPVSSILGLVNILRFETTNQTILDYTDKIELSAKKLDKFIKDIVTFSRSSYERITSSKIEIKELIENIITQCSLHDQNIKKISLTLNIEETAPFYTDHEKLENIIENLVRNAITFFDERKEKSFINVIVIITPEGLTLEISDNGIGIGNSHIPHIFTMFYRASERSKGAGLGLFIVKECLRKLKATIKIDTEGGLGTTFKVNIPNDDKGKLINRKLNLKQSKK